MGPIGHSVCHLPMYPQINSLPFLCSAPCHRGNGPCPSCFLDSIFPAEFSQWGPLEGHGRIEGREQPGYLSPSLLAWGGPSKRQCVPSVAPAPLARVLGQEPKRWLASFMAQPPIPGPTRHYQVQGCPTLSSFKGTNCIESQ